ncbi:glycosyltransferase [Enterobacter quasiroggenkampii]|uniref:ATP-grasp fold amidoligase family protein n=1 Tax=Enterobacter quasiroggenkampii TaxID=2497436 RepID=UPI0021CF9F48|nr:ATP-grasp fold amidoligase family protein [Enterobacter quasiroggenkampii]MCU6388827.1 glycosyltransferase [Enterobacter quasiroggenkampii]
MNNLTLKLLEHRLKTLARLFISDFHYREARFIKTFGFRPDMTDPKTFNEKLMYRMVQSPVPHFTELADKVRARQIVRERVGSQYLVPLVGVWRHPEDIPLDIMPDRFVLKCSHDSGSAVVCRDRATHDFAATRRWLNYRLKRNMYNHSREWQYRHITPQIIAEALLDFSQDRCDGFTPENWRLHCFHGTPRFLEVEYMSDSGVRHSAIYDPAWNRLPVRMGYPALPVETAAPLCLQELLRVAATLTAGLDYCRADFYVCGGNILFSEFTLTPSNGREVFTPDEWDLEFGRHWQLAPQDIPTPDSVPDMAGRS